MRAKGGKRIQPDGTENVQMQVLPNMPDISLMMHTND